ncbi:MAG: FGGY-family carbohydrate kinase [Thainema sp.]
MNLYLHNFCLGVDFGTSGARAIAVNPDGQIQSESRCAFSQSDQQPDQWQAALWSLLDQLPLEVRCRISAIAVNGTSSTVLLCDRNGVPVRSPLLYNNDCGKAVLDQIRRFAPADHVVLSATSSLAKLLWWETQPDFAQVQESYLLHQADWISFLLHGQLGISDYHNALKLGYDVQQLAYPDWLRSQPLRSHLPKVLAPGAVIGTVTPEVSQRFKLPSDCVVCAGTTDSIAAFLASGAQHPGEAVTSLGSTLVLKLLSETRVDRAEYGIYSHRFGSLWLVGGASNTGGAVLQQFFSSAELQALSLQIDPEQDSGLDYYPLTKSGERFPINDPNLPPRMTPRPDDPVQFLQGLLEGMARIEAQGYARLQQLGASPLRQVFTAGGGAQNQVWTKLRSRYLGVPVFPSVQTEAACGTALLARRQDLD